MYYTVHLYFTSILLPKEINVFFLQNEKIDGVLGWWSS